jgi:hypothetical protein
MAAYDYISVPDYNNIRNKISGVMSTGSATLGYGQALQSSLVATGDAVTKTQWDNLRFDVVNAIVHQSGSVPTITTINEGELLRYAADQPNYQYSTLASLAETNRFDLGTGQYVTEAGTSRSNSVSFSGEVASTCTISFTSADQARYFFNSGGKIRFTSAFTQGASPTQQDNSWNTTLSATSASPAVFGGNSPAVNFYTLTNSYQTFYQLSSSSPYSSNRWQIDVLCNIGNNNSGGATSITFRSRWIDGYTDPGFPPPGDAVNGTMSWTITHVRASGALYPNLTPQSFNAPSPAYAAPSTIA